MIAMNDCLRPCMQRNNRFCTVYMDDILIFSKNMEEHAVHLRTVLQLLAQAGYACRRAKCCFGVPSVTFLGHIVSAEGLAVDPIKVDLVQNWPEPADVGQIRSFVGLVQYFQRFIPTVHTNGSTVHTKSGDCPRAADGPDEEVGSLRLGRQMQKSVRIRQTSVD